MGIDEELGEIRYRDTYWPTGDRPNEDRRRLLAIVDELSSKLGEEQCACEMAVQENRELRAEVARLTAALKEACDGYEETLSYADSYFVDKWDLRGTLTKARAALAAAKPTEPKEPR